MPLGIDISKNCWCLPQKKILMDKEILFREQIEDPVALTELLFIQLAVHSGWYLIQKDGTREPKKVSKCHSRRQIFQICFPGLSQCPPVCYRLSAKLSWQ